MELDGLYRYSNHVSNVSIPIYKDISLIHYVERFTNIDINSLSDKEINYIKSNINLENCYITNISKLKSGKLISLVIPDIEDNYKLVNTYRTFYWVTWKKSNGDYYSTINVNKPSLFRNGIECNYLVRKEDYIGYINGMGCELIDLKELLVPYGTEKVRDNLDYINNQDVITDENIIDTSIFFKKEDV